MELIAWSENHSVKVQEIDDQHKKLIETVNKLYEHMKKGKGGQVLEETIDGLVEYTKYHFETEEKYMLEFKFDGYEDHKKEHDEFSEKVNDYYAKHKSGEKLLTSDICVFIFNWIKNHMEVVDSQYVECFVSNGLI